MRNLKQSCVEVHRPAGYLAYQHIPVPCGTHIHTLCVTSLSVFVLFFNAALDCGGENALLCGAASETRSVSAPRENGFHH